MTRLFAVCAVIVAACDPSPSRLDAPPDRLARLERRLDKVARVLDQALGPDKPDPTATYAVPISPLDPIEGPADARVTIVEAYEFLCPYCFLVDPTVQQLRAKYPKDVRVVSKYLVIHGQPAATIGTYACAAAKQGKFSELRAALWSGLWTLDAGAPKLAQDRIADVLPIARAAGLDVAALTRDADACQAWLASSRETLGAVGVNVTPTFFVNGRPTPDRSFATFDKMVQEELAKVAASGVAPVAYYEREVIAKGLARPHGRFDD
jgi:protein-disulfide isomerase